MSYKVRLTHIHSDFSLEPAGALPWTVELNNDDDLILLMNRVAVETTQHVLGDHPELEITVGSRRSIVAVVSGQLYYTDIHSQNRKGLKLVAEEIISMLQGKPVDLALRKESEDDDVGFVHHPAPSLRYWSLRSMRRGLRYCVLLLLIAVCATCSLIVWESLSDEPSLLAVDRFVSRGAGADQALREFSGVYVGVPGDGGLVLRLMNTARFELYEMWYSEDKGGFILVLIESGSVEVGSHDGEPALLAGGVYLILAEGENALSILGIELDRYFGRFQDLGEVGRLSSFSTSND